MGITHGLARPAWATETGTRAPACIISGRWFNTDARGGFFSTKGEARRGQEAGSLHVCTLAQQFQPHRWSSACAAPSLLLLGCLQYLKVKLCGEQTLARLDSAGARREQPPVHALLRLSSLSSCIYLPFFPINVYTGALAAEQPRWQEAGVGGGEMFAKPKPLK